MRHGLLRVGRVRHCHNNRVTNRVKLLVANAMMRRFVTRGVFRLPVVGVGAARSMSDAETQNPVHKYEQFATAENQQYIEQLLEIFSKDRNAVDSSFWPLLEALSGSESNPADIPIIKGLSRPAGGKIDEVDQKRIDNLKFAWLVRAYEAKGHLIADLDPLGIHDADLSGELPPELQPSFFGFSEEDMHKTFNLERNAEYIGSYTDGPTRTTLRDVVKSLNRIYARHIGFEFMHLRSVEEQVWLRRLILEQQPPRISKNELMKSLVEAEGFEKLLHSKFQTAKRFGSEGVESVIPMLQVMLDEAAREGFTEAVFSMAHRGRLNILHNVLGKDLGLILNEFKGLTHPDNKNNLGDVKYHLGHEAEIKTRSGRTMKVQMLPNPSHLECVAPVSQGVVRAKNTTAGDRKVLHVVLHGDAAFSGQGVCYETVAMERLENFTVDGTIHVITNNQIGFTTNPNQSRSAAYCSDLARLNNCPVFHVNADRPWSGVRVAEVAAQYRAKFKRDVIIDLVCYRRNGHNEADQPRYTQPLMYKAIDQHPTVSTIFARQQETKDRTVSDPKTLEGLRKEVDAQYREHWYKWEKSNDFVEKKWHDPVLAPYECTPELLALRETGVSAAKLQAVGKHLCQLPADFAPHPLVEAVINKRAETYAAGDAIEWASGEQLALATLLLEGHGVRISGQDVERGTFSQRHYNLHDKNNGNTYNSLETLDGVTAPVSVKNSLLSEFAVAGFEMGYSAARPNDLVMWEAQFGDFANGAQIIWDNFVSGSEAKWGQVTSLIVSLPHGYDGQGPEHSSGRLERFLQLEGSDDVVPQDFEMDGASADHLLEARIKRGNWQVTFPTTAANYYHLLRRQMHREFRKPLINFFSKAALRANEAKSSIADFDVGTKFQPVIDQGHISKARRVLFCTGQVSMSLVRAQAKNNTDDVAVVRIEQIAPFPWEQVATVMDKYRAANSDVEFAWVQDEPRNMGAWNYVRPRFRNLLVQRGVPLKDAANMRYIGRGANGSPATGYPFVHKAEEQEIVRASFE